MRLTLVPHPDTPCAGVSQIAVEAVRAGGRLSLSYRVEGDLTGVVLAARGVRGRADDLWKHSCFEAFISAGDSYRELNLSPSNRWAAYRFDGYRSGMAPDDQTRLLSLEERRSASLYELEAELDLAGLPAGASWSAGLSAVIEQADGARCFWALRHAPGKPDFHHPEAFVLRLGPSEQP